MKHIINVIKIIKTETGPMARAAFDVNAKFDVTLW